MTMYIYILWSSLTASIHFTTWA